MVEERGGGTKCALRTPPSCQAKLPTTAAHSSRPGLSWVEGGQHKEVGGGPALKRQRGDEGSADEKPPQKGRIVSELFARGGVT